MNDLVTWLRAQLDEDEAGFDDGLGAPCEGKGLHLWPERAEAEVEAKRRILDLHQPERGGVFVDLWCQQCQRKEDPCPTVRLLALPYVDRPGYRQEWAP